MLRNGQNARLYGTFVRQFSLNCYALPVVIVLMRPVGLRPAGSVATSVTHTIWWWRRRTQVASQLTLLGFASPRGPTDGRIFRDGPPRMEGRSTWSGRERSSHSRFPPVPRVGLVTFLFLSVVCPAIGLKFLFRVCAYLIPAVSGFLQRFSRCIRGASGRFFACRLLVVCSSFDGSLLSLPTIFSYRFSCSFQ